MKNKTRKLLGRFAAALIILALVLSVFSCAKVPTEDGAVVDSLKTENNIPPENNKEKTGEKTDSLAENVKDLDPVTVANNDKLLQTDVQQEYKPLEFELDDEFSPYDVVVTLTEEESAKGKDYKVEDFAEYDIFHVFEYSEYYSKEYYPQLEKNRTLVLMLENPSKERVLEYCEKLEKDLRVQFARPNVDEYLNESVLKYKVELNDGVEYIDAKDYPEIDLFSIYSEAGEEDIGRFEKRLKVGEDKIVYFTFNEYKGDKYQALRKNIQDILAIDVVKNVRPLYSRVYEQSVGITLDDNQKNNVEKFTKEYFSPIKIKEIEVTGRTIITLEFEVIDKKNSLDAVKIINTKEEFGNVELTRVGEALGFVLQDGKGHDFADYTMEE